MSKKDDNKKFPAYLAKKEPAWLRNNVAAIKSFLVISTGCERYTDIEEYSGVAQKYFSEDRDHLDDLLKWKKESGLAPRTASVYISCVREFLKSGGIILDEDDTKDLKKAFRGGIEVPEDAPDKNKIRSFLEHCDVRMKAVVFLLSSSGLRLGELTALTKDSFDEELRMITLKAAETKGQQGRIVFYSKEAEKSLNEWLLVRDKFIKKNNEVLGKSFRVNRLTKDDGRIFPYSSMSINKIWNTTLKKAGLSKKNDLGFQIFHPHTLRQYFSTQMRKAGCPDSFVEGLLGHTHYLPTYIRYSKEEKQELYEEYSSALIIGKADDIQRTVAALAKKAEEQNDEMQALKEKIKTLEELVKVLTHYQPGEAMEFVGFKHSTHYKENDEFLPG